MIQLIAHAQTFESFNAMEQPTYELPNVEALAAAGACVEKAPDGELFLVKFSYGSAAWDVFCAGIKETCTEIDSSAGATATASPKSEEKSDSWPSASGLHDYCPSLGAGSASSGAWAWATGDPGSAAPAASAASCDAMPPDGTKG